MTRPLDLRSATAEEAARAVHFWIGARHRDKPLLWTPAESQRRGHGPGWLVVWEGGPFEWAQNLSSDTNIYAGDVDDIDQTAPPQFAVVGAKQYCAEPVFSYALGFYPETEPTPAEGA